MTVNFPKNDLLVHRDVSIFFHEFGHIMHHMSAVSNYSRLSGASTELDFAELPS
jgi:thimet oligopeptidase